MSAPFLRVGTPALEQINRSSRGPKLVGNLLASSGVITLGTFHEVSDAETASQHRSSARSPGGTDRGMWDFQSRAIIEHGSDHGGLRCDCFGGWSTHRRWSEEPIAVAHVSLGRSLERAAVHVGVEHRSLLPSGHVHRYGLDGETTSGHLPANRDARMFVRTDLCPSRPVRG